MRNSARTVVENMFAAFSSGDVDKFVATVSNDTVWVYHGTQIIPKGTFEGKEGVRTFFNNILNAQKLLPLNPNSIS